jgi:hypothetical protein
MLQTLDKQGFITASNNGLWAILQTPGGQLTVDKMLQTLDKQGFITASNDGLWAILRTPGGQRTVDNMMQYTGQHFLLMTKGGFWSQMLKNGSEFERCLRQAVDAFDMVTIARIMATCASRFCDETYRSLLYDALALEPRDRMIGYCREYGAHLVKLQMFAPVYATTPSWTIKLGRALKAKVKPDGIAPLTKVTPDVWLQIHDPDSVGARPSVLQAAAADGDVNGRDANGIQACHVLHDMRDFEDAPPFRAARRSMAASGAVVRPTPVALTRTNDGSSVGSPLQQSCAPVPAFPVNESDGGADSPRRTMVTDGSLTAEERLTANWFVSCSFRAFCGLFCFRFI